MVLSASNISQGNAPRTQADDVDNGLNDVNNVSVRALALWKQFTHPGRRHVDISTHYVSEELQYSSDQRLTW